MKIFEPVPFQSGLLRSAEIIPSFLGKFFKGFRLIGAVQEGEPVCQLFQLGNRLMELELYFQNLTEDLFEHLLHSAARLEAKRKELRNEAMQEIGICILAPKYDTSLLDRISYGIVHLRLFEYILMRTDDEQGMMAKEIRKNTFVHAANETSPKNNSEIHSDKLHPRLEFDLSTPELVAFTRLGIEIRQRRLNPESHPAK